MAGLVIFIAKIWKSLCYLPNLVNKFLNSACIFGAFKAFKSAKHPVADSYPISSCCILNINNVHLILAIIIVFIIIVLQLTDFTISIRGGLLFAAVLMFSFYTSI